MASLDMDCVEFDTEIDRIETDRIDSEIENQDEENMEVHHIRLTDQEVQNFLNEGDVETENHEIVTEVKLEKEDDFHLTVIVPSESDANLDASMLTSNATQIVQLGSGGMEPVSLMADNAQILSGQFVHLVDGTTAVLQQGNYQVIQLPDGTSALLPAGIFADVGVDGAQLNLEQVDEQIENEEEGDVFSQGSVASQHAIIDPDLVSGGDCPPSSETIANMSGGGDEGDLGLLADQGERISVAKTFKCNFEMCGRLYTTHHHLKVHMRSHTGDRPFRCDFSDCNKAFATGYGLKSHRRIHTGEKPYPCVNERCDKAFKTSGDLQKHMRTHTGERPFLCPYKDCNRSFTTSNIRKVHIRTHTGERPYSCDVKGCGKTFASATNYKNHIRIHSGEKPYECSVAGCGRRFTEYSSLYKHHVVHTHTKPYPCETCGKTYRQTSTLAMHKRMAHGDDTGNGDFVSVLVQTSHPKQSATVRLSENGSRGPDDNDGNLVIDTSDANQGSMTGSSSTLLHQLPTTISISGSGSRSHVLVITDPSQIEAIQRISEQGN